MEPTELLPIIATLMIITVEFGGHALLRFITTDREKLGEMRERFFRAGHAHAGVILVIALVYFLYLPRAGFSEGVEWLFGLMLLVGGLAQSGGFFLHVGVGKPGEGSIGTVVTRVGALLIAASLVALAVGLIKEA